MFYVMNVTNVTNVTIVMRDGRGNRNPTMLGKGLLCAFARNKNVTNVMNVMNVTKPCLNTGSLAS